MFLAKLKVGTTAVLCAAVCVAAIGGSLSSLLFAQDARPAQEVEIVPGTEKDRGSNRQTESDLAFIRRVSKELRDTVPTPAEIHFFVSSKDAGRREKLIELFKQERQVKNDELMQRGVAVKRVELRARVTGYLIKVHFKAGDVVKKDQLLFEIDPRPYQAALDAAEAQIQLTDANVKSSAERVKQGKVLFDKGALAPEEYSQAVTDLAAAEASRKLAVAGVALARLNVDFTKISAFIDGKISAPSLNVGNLVTADVTSLAVIDSVDTVPMKQKR